MSKINHQLTDIQLFGPRLETLIEKHNMSQNQFASKLGLSKAIVSDYINGNKIPSLNTLITIADTFNVSFDYLLGKTNFETVEFVERKFAESLNLSSDSVTGLIEHFHLFKEFCELIKFPFINEFIEEFIKSDIIPDLICSAFFTCLKNDKIFVYETISMNNNIDLQIPLENLDNKYLTVLNQLMGGAEYIPNEIIDKFCDRFTLSLPEFKKEQLQSASSISSAGDILRNPNNPLGKDLFSCDCKYISSYVP